MTEHTCRLTTYADHMTRLAETTRATRRGWWARHAARLYESEAASALLTCANERGGPPGRQTDYRLAA